MDKKLKTKMAYLHSDGDCSEIVEWRRGCKKELTDSNKPGFLCFFGRENMHKAKTVTRGFWVCFSPFLAYDEQT